MRFLKVLMVLFLVFSVAGCASFRKGTKTKTPTTAEELTPRITDESGIKPTITAPADLERVHFDFDSYALRSDAREILKGNAEFLKSRPNLEVQLQGHCDERGSTEYNLALGEKRARSVKEYLVKLGVNSNSLSVVSYGEEMPLDKEQTEAAYATNRRVEFAKLTK